MKKTVVKAAALIMSGVIAVSGAQSASAATKAMEVNKKNITVTVNKTSQLKVKNKAKGAKVTWKSKNTKIAAVSKKGVVTGKAEGSTKIICTVSYKNKKKKVTKKFTTAVKVTKPVTTEKNDGVKLTTPGIYKTVYEKTAMGSTISYYLTLELKEDNTYNYSVSFNMGGEDYEGKETGTYTASEGKITLTSDAFVGKDSGSIVGTYTENSITMSRYISSFAFSTVEVKFEISKEESK